MRRLDRKIAARVCEKEAVEVVSQQLILRSRRPRLSAAPPWEGEMMEPVRCERARQSSIFQSILVRQLDSLTQLTMQRETNARRQGCCGSNKDNRMVA